MKDIYFWGSFFATTSLLTSSLLAQQPLSPSSAPTHKNMHRVTNGITSDQTAYYKMFKNRYPEEFTVSINGKPLASGSSIETKDPLVEVTYEYRWKTPWGAKTGKHTAHFQLNTQKKQHTLTFEGWKKKKRLALENAQELDDQ